MRPFKHEVEMLAGTRMDGGRRRRVQRSVLAVALSAAAGLLAAGCQGSAAPVTTAPGARTVATVSRSSTPTTSPATGRARTLPTCGATRDPFDPSGAPPPAGSPARC
jgi:hypothetical protein